MQAGWQAHPAVLVGWSTLWLSCSLRQLFRPCALSRLRLLCPTSQRSDCKDSLAIYDCATWQPRAQFPTATADLADLAWSPDGTCLAVWESALYGHQVGAG